MGGLAVAVLAGFLLGSDALSYLSTSYERVSARVQDSVPMEFQIDRARKMVRDLEPEIRRSMHVIAKEEVEVQNLDKQISRSEEKSSKDKSEIMRLQSDLKTGKLVFHYAGNRYTTGEVRKDLSRRFARFKTSDATLGSLRDMRDARQCNLDAARQKLSAMMTSQRQLQVEVANLDAKLKLVEVAQASSDFQLDDSQLARAKQLMRDIRTRLDVAAKLANADIHFQAEIPLDEAATETIVDQVAEYFRLGDSEDSMFATASYEEELERRTGVR
jgi:predicted  nucleic acid-binding Zn-ribbon protein